MRIEGLLTPFRFGPDSGFTDPVAAATTCEAAGYGTFWAQEQNLAPVVALSAAAPATRSIGLGSGVLVALARSPMTVAQSAHDLNVLSRGRFVLGLGPQFAANLTYRFSMPGDRRLARLREHVAALRAIWSHWNEGEPLSFRGEFYTHTLTNPFFTPPPSPYGAPPVMLAATGPRMAELAGEIANGLIAPPYANRDHLLKILLPAAERGLERSGRSREDFTIVLAPLLAITSTDTEHARQLVALWCGTRAYRFIFDAYGLGGLSDDLAELSLSADPDRWRRMADRIDDDILDLFAVRTEPQRLGSELRVRFGGPVNRLIVPAPTGPDSPYHPGALGLAAADPHLETT
ncbi:TIGR03617 family F420-dependent LLM class oxidoreductase [Streptomyces sp. Ac-502]|uniref:TIGR03617 family F420-dependent LLM class oxidoreductase n=1 Tax=Streptomyces sp. Ac-502 TaxID=3342801 RepID=UPI003862A81D